MAAVLGLAAAAGYGAADFLGGWASRRDGVLPVVVWSQLAGLALLVVVLAPLAGGPPTVAALAWGGAAGAAVAVGLAVYFRGLARARMGVVAPTTAVVTAAVPVCAGLLAGERPSVLALAGVVSAVVAVALVSLAPSDAGPPGPPGPLASTPRAAPGSTARTRGVLTALVAGGAFGLFFICMDRTGASAAVWPLLAANVASLAVLAATVAVTHRPWRPARASLPAIAAAGVFGTVASLAFLLAVRLGLLSLVSVLASLSPVVTVALARMVVGERLAGVQLGGLAAAVAGVGLIAAGLR